MGSACSSDSGSFESSSGSSSDSSDNSSEDDASSEDRSSQESLEVGNLSASQKLRNRTRSIISGIKIRSPKEEPLEIVQTTNKDGVSLIRKLRLIRRLGPLSKAVNAAEESTKMQIPEIRVTKAPNSFLRRAKMVKLGSLTKSPKAEEKSPKTEKKSPNAFLRKAKFLGSISRSAKSEKDEESIEEEKKSPRGGGFLRKAKGLARLSSLSKSPPSESKSPPPQVSAPPIPPRTVNKPLPLCPKPRHKSKIAAQQQHQEQQEKQIIAKQVEQIPASPSSSCDEPNSPVESNDSESLLETTAMMDEVNVQSSDSENEQQTDSDPDSGISGEATDLSQINFNLRDIDELDDLANDLFPVTLELSPETLSHKPAQKYHTSLKQSRPKSNPVLASSPPSCKILSSQNANANFLNTNNSTPFSQSKSKVETEEQPTKSYESTEKDPAQQETPQIQIQAEQDQENLKENSPEAKQEEEEEQLVESKNIGSVNTRLSRYQSRANQSPEVRKEPVPKVSTIDKFKDNYLKQTEKAGSTVQAEMATSGALSLKDRMKMFENQSSRSVQREVVGQAERAGDIRSKISNWGVSDSTNSYSQRERITVAPLSDRRSQYTAVANAN
ncbi:Oidioi.mRNA.OKI2018_I69.XSR.g16688.t1.cds [Oikopleura dioica]|uniref:Oidioi.mRNA.OKI2018_I69.XSR.g16688.t1.cds n=1 Tax=Oikopleura dioica TaxID=34765 RepID=A0ABN7SGY8_OIKDI|nr:Oidioi.mRNA.OKI2018_I69.XSR.g16688.t1.cds [Oikopleura dioica]